MAATSPSGEAKTCAGPFPPVLVVERKPLKVPLSKMVNDWIAPSSTSLTALRTRDTSISSADTRGLHNVLEDGGIDDGSLDPRGVLSRGVLLHQGQSLVDAVEHIRSNEGNVSAGEDIEFDHNSRLWWEEVRRGGRGRDIDRRGGCIYTCGGPGEGRVRVLDH
jgi:hypothetical protein